MFTNGSMITIWLLFHRVASVIFRGDLNPNKKEKDFQIVIDLVGQCALPSSYRFPS
jgi:hypothetical protein